MHGVWLLVFALIARVDIKKRTPYSTDNFQCITMPSGKVFVLDYALAHNGACTLNGASTLNG